MPAYDTNNIFAKILRGEFSCHKMCWRFSTSCHVRPATPW